MDTPPAVALENPPVALEQKSITRHSYKIMYLAVFLLSLVTAGTLYINSSYLTHYFSSGWLSTLYIFGAVGNLAGLAIGPSLIRRWSNFHCLVVYLLGETAALFGLALIHQIVIVALLFIVQQMLPPLALFSFDIVLERAIDTESITGGVRSLYLTASNAAYVVVPFFVGTVVTSYSFQAVYAITGILMVAVVILASTRLGHTEPQQFRQASIVDSIRSFSTRRGLVEVFASDILLESFYAIMSIFLPLYLYFVIGFPWQTIGLIISIMLIPFVIFEAPLGRIFDYFRVERDTIMIGFFIMSVSTAALFFINSHNAITWAALLFISRIGSSFVEVGNEYSFFRRVNASDAGFISIFRSTYPLAYIIGPLTLIFLGSASSHIVFMIAAVFMLCGVFVAYRLPPRPRRV